MFNRKLFHGKVHVGWKTLISIFVVVGLQSHIVIFLKLRLRCEKVLCLI